MQISPSILFLISLIFGLLTLVSVILTIISFANSAKSKFTWLIIFLLALVCTIVFASFTVTAFMGKVKHLTDGLQQDMIREMEKQSYQDYYFSDSINSKQLAFLKLIEPEDVKGAVPAQFYNYLGYQQYYRLPLRYPFSLHCDDLLDNASLYDESRVENFNINDNGEKSCDVSYITEFAFDKNILLVKQRTADDLKKFTYMIYHFESGEQEKFNDLESLKKRALALQFSKTIRFYDCNSYYESLKKEL